MHRRTFLLSAVPMAALPLRSSNRLPIASAVEYSMLPTNVWIEERFQLAKDTGFERIECPTRQLARDLCGLARYRVPGHGDLRTGHGRSCLFERCLPAFESHTRRNNAGGSKPKA